MIISRYCDPYVVGEKYSDITENIMFTIYYLNSISIDVTECKCMFQLSGDVWFNIDHYMNNVLVNQNVIDISKILEILTNI